MKKKDHFWVQQKQSARKLLTQQLGAAAKEATLISANKVIWRNGALGCPGSDRSYTQQLVDGVEMIWSVEGRNYYLHGDNSGGLFICTGNRQKPYRTGWQGFEYETE